MRSDWPIRRLEEIADEITVGYVGSMANEYIESGVPFLRSLNIERFGINTTDLKFISHEFHSSLKKSSLKPNDVVIVRTGKPGTCAVIPNWLNDANCSDLVIVRCGQEILPRFLCYWVNSVAVNHISAHLVGAVQQHFNVGAAKKMQIALPTLQEQEKIVSILGALDDRITLLRETNVTLEAIAQALFKSWFVNFDPVRAKQERREPQGMDAEVAALFPEEFEESASGLIPKEWKIGKLGDVLSLRNERAKPSEDIARLPYVPIECISSKVPFLQDNRPGDEANSSLILFRQGDVLFGAMRPYFHKVCIAPYDGVTRTTVFTLCPKNRKAAAYGLFQAYQDATVEYATQHSEGSTIPYAKWKGSLEMMPIVLPPEAIQEAFSSIVEQLINKANNGLHQVAILAELRDQLLPRLVSGRIRLPEAEKQFTEALTGT